MTNPNFADLRPGDLVTLTKGETAVTGRVEPGTDDDNRGPGPIIRMWDRANGDGPKLAHFESNGFTVESIERPAPWYERGLYIDRDGDAWAVTADGLEPRYLGPANNPHHGASGHLPADLARYELQRVG